MQIRISPLVKIEDGSLHYSLSCALCSGYPLVMVGEWVLAVGNPFNLGLYCDSG